MLRSRLTQPVRFQRLELIKRGSERRHVQFGLEGKVIAKLDFIHITPQMQACPSSAQRVLVVFLPYQVRQVT